MTGGSAVPRAPASGIAARRWTSLPWSPRGPATVPAVPVALRDLELNPLAFFQGEGASLNRAVVHEDVRAVVYGDKAVALGGVEPLDRAGRHPSVPSPARTCAVHSRKVRAAAALQSAGWRAGPLALRASPLDLCGASGRENRIVHGGLPGGAVSVTREAESDRRPVRRGDGGGLRGHAVRHESVRLLRWVVAAGVVTDPVLVGV